MRIGLIGCGNIAQGIVNAIKEGKLDASIGVLFDLNIFLSRKLSEKITPRPIVVDNIEDLLKVDNIDLVVEVASQDAVLGCAKKILENKKDLMLLSVGALVDSVFLGELEDAAKKNKVKIYIPSGAIVGLDGVSAGKVGRIDSVVLTTRKNPLSLGIGEGEVLSNEKIIFEGSAKEVVRKYPKNINIAATLSLVGIGFDKTIVRIIADPKVKQNIHEIHVKGIFGEFTVETKNLPSEENPKTSYLAILSAISLIKKISERKEDKNGLILCV